MGAHIAPHTPFFKRKKRGRRGGVERERKDGERGFSGFEDINYRDYFNISSTGLMGHEMKLHKSRFNTTIRGNNSSLFLKE